jgi:hypothetical protein
MTSLPPPLTPSMMSSVKQFCLEGPCYGPLKLKPSSNISLIGVIIVFIYYGPPPTTMDAVSATIVAGGQAQFQ